MKDIVIPETSDFDFGVLSVPEVTWAVFLIALVIFAIYSGILFYHWFEFNLREPMIWPTIIIYSAVSFVLVAVLFFSVLSI